MADIEFGDAVGGATPARALNMTGVMNWLGAIISLSLIAGLAYWGYQLVVRDVSGVPVVRALEGPMRVAPQDPGGLNASHQGLAVNNIAAVGEAEAPADRLVLAPRPTVLRPEDQTAAALSAMQAEAKGGEITSLTNTAEAGEAKILDQASLIDAALRQAQDTSASLPATVPQSEVIDASIVGVSQSLRPILRPQSVFASASAAPAATSQSPGIQIIDPDQIPAGTRLVQLGAFESAEIAKQEWLRLAAQFDDFMAEKSRVIQQAQSGGKVFYRLRAHGFEDLSDARRFCSALLARQANCIPVVTR
ncbi:MAG: SPOR domain-containing protein [Paracoccaceae bacterium]